MKLVPDLEHILKIIMTPLYLISGVIIPIASIPQPYRDWLLLNPIAHGLEGCRLGFFDYYNAVFGLSLSYLYGASLVLFFLGLLLYRRFHHQLVSR
jgi:capsular polysaccharide transport system permease protein